VAGKEASSSVSVSAFLEFTDTDLLRRGSLDWVDWSETSDTVVISDKGVKEAVEPSKESSSCPPRPRGKDASERPVPWSMRGLRELGGEEATGEGATAAAAAGEAAPAMGAAPLVGAMTSLAVAKLPVREPPPGKWRG
jgi:hypothetical protein